MKKKLRDIADIRTGYQFREKVAASEDANVVVIQIKDVDEKQHILTDDLVPVKIENPEGYLVADGDVLFLSRGPRQYAVVAMNLVQKTIATGYFFILRPREKVVKSGFLAWSMNQPEFQEGMRPFVRGSHIPIISKADFQDLTIRLPSLAVQERITDLQNLFDRECKLTAAILSKRGDLLQAISQELMTGQLRITGES